MARQEYFIPDDGTLERVFLVGLSRPGESPGAGLKTLEELKRLTITAGAEIVGTEHLRLREIHAGVFIGHGHAQTLKGLAAGMNADGVIFDEDLSPAQTRNLEEALELRVLDRTTLILDIFAQHARTKEGKLQVELAQLEYLLPRLRGRGIEMSRLGGGIGTRGPGETKLETDRRRILKRISRLKEEIGHVRRHRSTQRQRRIREGIPTLSLAGYTNSGKSTLLRALTAADVLVEDKLFSTLDPTARRLTLPNGQEAVLVDTVGFIRKLPHTLVAAFRATLEEIEFSDAILLMNDGSSPDWREELAASREVLETLDVMNKPILTVFNKMDLVDRESGEIRPGIEEGPCVHISAAQGEGLDRLLAAVESLLRLTRVTRNYLIRYHRFDLLSRIQRLGKDVETHYDEEFIHVSCHLSPEDAERLHDEDMIETGPYEPPQDAGEMEET